MLTRKDLDADQINAIAFIESGEDSLLCADVGTGKTVIAYTAADDALMNGDVDRWLVLAPLLVADETWRDEPGEWEHLQDLRVSFATGTPQQRIDAIDADTDIVVMNYENLMWLMEQFPRRGKHDPLPFDGLICDEIDKLKDVSSKRFKDFRNRIKKFRKRIGMTGTLVPNDLTEVWGQTFMVDGGESFGRSFYEWRREYFYPTDFNQRVWAPHTGTREHMIEQLSSLAFRLEAHGIPPVTVRDPIEFELPERIRSYYNRLENDFYIKLEGGRTVDAANAAVLSGKLQQICAGFSYVDGTKEAVWHSFVKFDWLDKMLTEHADEQVLIFYHFNEERDELRRRYPNMAFLGKGTRKQKRAMVQAWNRGELRRMALHPASAGHGLNLQKSGAYLVAFLTVPWSGGMFKQVTGRLARRGQTADEIIAHSAVFGDTIDKVVYGTVTGRITGMEDFLNDLAIATAA